jgi:hypothetical protein
MIILAQAYGDYPWGVKWTQAQAFVNGELWKKIHISNQKKGVIL